MPKISEFPLIFVATPLDPSIILINSAEFQSLTFLLSVKHIKAHPQLLSVHFPEDKPPLVLFISPHFKDLEPRINTLHFPSAGLPNFFTIHPPFSYCEGPG